MHIEILVEDSSGEALLQQLVPLILGDIKAVSHRIHSYKGIGRIPKDLRPKAEAQKRILLDNLPRLLRGYKRTPGVDAVLVVLDSDTRDCKEFLSELTALASKNAPELNVMFRLAIEEVEAWYLGDLDAVIAAYPTAKRDVLSSYLQDTICNTWELLADAVRPGGSKAVLKAGWPLPGQIKHEWATNIGPNMSIEQNTSPSFRKLRDGLRRLAST